MLVLIFSHPDIPHHAIFLCGGPLVVVLILEFFAWLWTRDTLMILCDACQLVLEVWVVHKFKVEETLVLVKAGADMIMMLVDHIDGQKLSRQLENAQTTAAAAVAAAAAAAAIAAAAVQAKEDAEAAAAAAVAVAAAAAAKAAAAAVTQAKPAEKKMRCCWCDGHGLTKQNRTFFLDWMDGHGDADLYSCSRCGGGHFKQCIHSTRDYLHIWWR